MIDTELETKLAGLPEADVERALNGPTGGRRSGWCTAPAGARPQHEHCRSEACGCECHTEGADRG